MDMSEFDPSKRTEVQLSCLKLLDPDILLMQECQKTELDALIAAEGGYLQEVYDIEFCPFPSSFWANWLTDSTNYEPRENGVCIMTKRSAVRKISAEHVPIDLPEWQEKLPKAALGARACLVTAELACWEGAKALIATSHLDADSAYRAGLQGEALGKQLMKREGYDVVIWGGDFNMEHRHSALKAIQKEGFELMSEKVCTPSVYSAAGCVRVDHVLCAKGTGTKPLSPECLGTFIASCPLGHLLRVVPMLSEFQWYVCTVKGERGVGLQSLTTLLSIAFLPLVIIFFSPLFVLACDKGKQRDRVSWALANWGSDHLPVTVCLKA